MGKWLICNILSVRFALEISEQAVSGSSSREIDEFRHPPETQPLNLV
jgi:hypothetical protein